MIETKVIMEILVEWAKKKTPMSYSDLSLRYMEKTGESYDHHGNWDKPLGLLNRELAAIGAPALSALVVLKGKNEPGGKFWGCASNVPERPKTHDERFSEWIKILNAVFAYNWDGITIA